MNIDNFDHVRAWTGGDFRLELFTAYQFRHGKDILAYQFFHRDRLVFEGHDFGCSPMHAIDGDETVAALLHFLSLKPGDTDSEYFEGYTPEQLDFARQHGEELYLYVEELEGTPR